MPRIGKPQGQQGTEGWQELGAGEEGKWLPMGTKFYFGVMERFGSYTEAVIAQPHEGTKVH